MIETHSILTRRTILKLWLSFFLLSAVENNTIKVSAFLCPSHNNFYIQSKNIHLQKKAKNDNAGSLCDNAIGKKNFRLNMIWGDEDENNSFPDRIKSCIPYMLPILDGDQFGRYIYQRIPPLNVVDQIFIQPLLQFYHSVPFLGLAVFLALSIGSRNANISRSLRFNAQQAILIDIALIFPEILGSVTQNNFPRMIVEPATNFVYYTYVSAVIYSIVSNLTGKKPNQIPIISEAAEMAVGPF